MLMHISVVRDSRRKKHQMGSGLDGEIISCKSARRHSPGEMAQHSKHLPHKLANQ